MTPVIYEDREDAERAKQARTYAAGPVKTWLKLGKNRYGMQGLCLALSHSKKYTRFDVPTEESEPGINANADYREPEERRIWQR